MATDSLNFIGFSHFPTRKTEILKFHNEVSLKIEVP